MDLFIIYQRIGSVEFTGGRSYRVEFSEEMNKEEVKSVITEVCENIPPEIKTVDNNFTLEITTKYLEGSETKNKVSKIDSSMVTAFANLGFVDDPT